jgi:arylsulfatase A-like enzyme
VSSSRRRAPLVYACRPGWIAGVLLALLTVACAEPAEVTPPNVLLYVIDTLRRDSLGIYGNTEVPTPRLDAFAQQGVVFDEAASPSSWTRASIATLLTGYDPPRHGAVDRTGVLSRGVPTLAERLADHGYQSAFVTANPNVASFFGFGRGVGEMVELFSRRSAGYVDAGELIARSDEVTRAALRWVDATPRPFFLTVLAIDPHSPYERPPGFDPMGIEMREDVDGSQASLQRPDLSPDQRAHIRDLYNLEVAYSDQSFGELLDGLRVRGLLENTLVIFTSDHGEEFWEHGRRGHGRSLSEAAVRIPLVVSQLGSEQIQRGSRRGDPAGLDDIAPTVLDLLQLPPDPTLPGRALFRGDSSTPTFARLMLDGHDLAMAREARWKLVWDLAEDEQALFDLTADPLEAKPVAPSATPESVAAHSRLQRAIAHGVEHPPSGGAGATAPLPPEIEKSLKALGYLGE